MPIHDATGEVIGVAEAVNKLSIGDEPFSELRMNYIFLESSSSMSDFLIEK